MTGTLTIGLTGDVMLGRTLDHVISQRGYAYPWGDVLPLMQQTDLNIINLETALTNSIRMVPKAFNFKCAPDKVQTLLNAHVNIVNIANNHILDFSADGLLETIETLDKAKIKHIGAGKNRAAAIRPLVIVKDRMRIGLLGLTDNEPDWKANGQPGINYVDLTDDADKENVLQTIANLKATTDLIIVSIHWGPNMQEKPYPHFVKFAHDMIDHGANMIHGHSAHILQGIECYSDNLICYDTGDFVDDYVVDPDLRNDLAAFFVLTVDRGHLVSLKCIPTRIFQYQVNLARDEDYAWVINRLQKLSSAFDTIVDPTGMIQIPNRLNEVTDRRIKYNV